jgi:hypothetical protein
VLPDDLVSAAWLHGIGYVSELVEPVFIHLMGRATFGVWALMGRS